MSQPLIITLRLDTASEKFLTSLRTRFFPTSRNYLRAHVTLFHALPASHLPFYTNYLTTLSSQENDFTLGLTAPFALGKKGVAINIASFKLRKLHEQIMTDLLNENLGLSDQDRRKLRPHVTVQNKVGEEEARRTLEVLKKEWKDGPGKAVGLSLWRYEVGGEWTFLRDFEFGPK